MAKNKKNEESREKRRKRRVKNQAISFIVLFVLIGCLGFGAYKGISYLAEKHQEKKAQEESLEASASENAAVSEDGIPESVLPEITEEIPEEEEEEEIPEDEVEIRAMLAEMPLEQKVANLFVVYPEAISTEKVVTSAGEDLREMLTKYAVGGILFRTGNITGAEELKTLLSDIQGMNQELYGRDLFMFVAEEGAVNTIAGTIPDVVAIDSANAIGSSEDSANAYNGFLHMGTVLAGYGVNANFGLCCAVGDAETCYLEERLFGSDGELVADMVHSAVSGLTDQKIMPCLLDFPGEGELTTDPTKEPAYVEKTLGEMRDKDLLPFISGIEMGAPMIRMSMAYYKAAFGEDAPATLSPVAIQTLREELGFEGVIVSANLSEDTIATRYTAAQASLLSFIAGCDIILCPADFAEAYAAMLNAVTDGTITEQRIDESLIRIYKMREEQGM